MATKRKKKKSSKGPILGLIAIGVLGLGSLAAYVKFGGASKVPESVKVASLKQPSSQGESSGKEQVELLSPKREGMDLKLGSHKSDVPAGVDARLYALNHYIRESGIMPKEAKAVGIQVKDRVALVDVTPEFNQTYGSLDEETLLKGLCGSLAQFRDIDKVQFFVEGKTVETLGNVDLTEPIPVRAPSKSTSNAN